MGNDNILVRTTPQLYDPLNSRWPRGAKPGLAIEVPGVGGFGLKPDEAERLARAIDRALDEIRGA